MQSAFLSMGIDTLLTNKQYIAVCLEAARGVTSSNTFILSRRLTEAERCTQTGNEQCQFMAETSALKECELI
jgi:hypothetical protein